MASAIPPTLNSVDAHVGTQIHEFRTRLGRSLIAMADAIGRSEHSLQATEEGLRRLSVAEMTQFSKKFSVPVSYFFDTLVDTKKLDPTSSLSRRARAHGSERHLEFPPIGPRQRRVRSAPTDQHV